MNQDCVFEMFWSLRQFPKVQVIMRSSWRGMERAGNLVFIPYSKQHHYVT